MKSTALIFALALQAAAAPAPAQQPEPQQPQTQEDMQQEQERELEQGLGGACPDSCPEGQTRSVQTGACVPIAPMV